MGKANGLTWVDSTKLQEVYVRTESFRCCIAHPSSEGPWVREVGGEQVWVPLGHLCFSRSPSHVQELGFFSPFFSVFAAAAVLLQPCPTLCDPVDGSPPGSPIPRILQARKLEWVAISFSNAWKWSPSVMSDSSRPHGLKPTRLLRPWDFPGKSTGVGCRCLLHFQCLLVDLFESFIAFSLYWHFGRFFFSPFFHDYQKTTQCKRNEIHVYQFLVLISRNSAKSYHLELHKCVSDWKSVEEPPLFIATTIAFFFFLIRLNDGNKIQMHKYSYNFSLNRIFRELPSGLVVRTPCFHCRIPGFSPWSGN